MINRNIDGWNVVFYKYSSLINKLRDLGVEIYNLRKIDNYKFYFETKRKNRKIIKDNFHDCKIVSRRGLFSYIEAMIKKTTIFSVVIAGLIMLNVSRRIWDINIVGDYESVERSIYEELVKNELEISKFYPSSERLKEIENSISLYLSKDIEFLEIRRLGSVINVRYQKRRIADELPIKGDSLYATKDGMIRYFDIASGVKHVKEYDYVRKGDLLVSDMLETSSGQLIDVGTLGKVFANTFYIIEVNLNYSDEDEASAFSKMLDKAKLRIASYLSKDEKIEIERVLDYKINAGIGYMKIYYMLLEDITI